MLEGCLEVSRLIERRRGAHEQVRRQCGGGDAEAFGALARPDADAARNTEYGVKAPGLRDGLLFDGRFLGDTICPPAPRFRCRRDLILTKLSGKRPRLVVAHDQGPQLRRVAALGGAHRRERQRDVAPIFTGLLNDLGAPGKLERRLAVARAAVEPGIVKRHPARTAHRVAHPQQRGCGTVGRKVEPHLHLARRVGLQLGRKPRELAIDLALLELGVADRRVGRGDLFGNRRKRGAPFGERTRLALVARSKRRMLGEALGKLLAHGLGGNPIVEHRAFVTQGFDPFFDFGRRHRPFGTRRTGIDRPDDEPRRAFALDAQRGRVQSGREVARDERRVAGGQFDTDQTRNRRAVRIDRDHVGRRADLEFGRARRRRRDQD